MNGSIICMFGFQISPCFKYRWDLNNNLVWYSDGSNLFGPDPPLLGKYLQRNRPRLLCSIFTLNGQNPNKNVEQD